MYYYHFVKTKNKSGYLSEDMISGFPILGTKSHCTSTWVGKKPLDVSFWGIDEYDIIEYRTEEVNKENCNET